MGDALVSYELKTYTKTPPIEFPLKTNFQDPESIYRPQELVNPFGSLPCVPKPDYLLSIAVAALKRQG